MHQEKNTKGFFKTLKEFFKLKEFRNICTYYLLSMIGFDIIMAIFLFYVGDTLGFNTYGGGALTMIFIAIPLIVAIASSAFWVKLTEKFNKHKVYFLAVILISISLLGILLKGILLNYLGSLLTTIILTIVITLFNLTLYKVFNMLDFSVLLNAFKHKNKLGKRIVEKSI